MSEEDNKDSENIKVVIHKMDEVGKSQVFINRIEPINSPKNVRTSISLNRLLVDLIRFKHTHKITNRNGILIK